MCCKIATSCFMIMHVLYVTFFKFERAFATFGRTTLLSLSLDSMSAAMATVTVESKHSVDTWSGVFLLFPNKAVQGCRNL